MVSTWPLFWTILITNTLLLGIYAYSFIKAWTGTKYKLFLLLIAMLFSSTLLTVICSFFIFKYEHADAQMQFVWRKANAILS